jgi:hypothetical protein
MTAEVIRLATVRRRRVRKPAKAKPRTPTRAPMAFLSAASQAIRLMTGAREALAAGNTKQASARLEWAITDLDHRPAFFARVPRVRAGSGALAFMGAARRLVQCA